MSLLLTVSSLNKICTELACNKAPGIDNIPIELVKNAGKETLNIISKLCQLIWKTTEWPVDWKRSVFLSLPKKGDVRECSNNRTISLIVHMSKILLKIIQKRLTPYIDREISIEQAGFIKGRGTRDQIANIRWILEKVREVKKEIYFCFIDYSKAFDCVDHNTMWLVMRKIGIPEHLIILIKNLYHKQEAHVRTMYGPTDWFEISKGVRQGCILSPYLFNLYGEIIMRNAGLYDNNIGIKVHGRAINNLRYADDTTLIAETKEDLGELIRNVKKASKEAGLLLNLKKTEVMTTAELNNVEVDGESIEVVQEFNFLGCTLTRTSDHTKEIRRRLMLGRKAMTNLTTIMKDKNITLNTKIRITEALVFPVVTYGSETWVIRKAEMKKIEAFELWVWRRLLRVPWTSRRTNEWVLGQIKTERSLLNTIRKRQLTYYGHINRADNSLEKLIMQGKIEGKRGRGRPATKWFDNIKTMTTRSVYQLNKDTKDRAGWRRQVHNITRGRTT